MDRRQARIAAVVAQGAGPRDRVVIVAVDERAVDI
jgi:hypothetical protein